MSAGGAPLSAHVGPLDVAHPVNLVRSERLLSRVHGREEAA
jgi:hypothetical protein